MGDYYSVYCKGAKQSLRFVYNEWLRSLRFSKGNSREKTVSWRGRIAGSYHYSWITALEVQFSVSSCYLPLYLVWLAVIVTVTYL
jgi:hypothetical protein